MAKPIPRNPEDPKPGLFKIKLVRGGPWVGARIYCWPDGVWYAAVDGKNVSDGGVRDPTQCREIMRIWQFGRDVTEAEYRTLTRQDRTVPINEKINLATKESIF